MISPQNRQRSSLEKYNGLHCACAPERIWPLSWLNAGNASSAESATCTRDLDDAFTHTPHHVKAGFTGYFYCGDSGIHPHP